MKKIDKAEIYNNFCEMMKGHFTSDDIIKSLKISLGTYYKLLDKYRVAKLEEQKKNKFKHQNIQAGYSDWISKILRVS
jgi:hypothetical protein